MRNIKTFLTIIFTFMYASSFAQRFKFEMHETDGKDYEVVINMQYQHICESVKETHRKHFSVDSVEQAIASLI